MRTYRSSGREGGRRFADAALSLLLLAGFAGCDSLLDVRNPGSVDADDLDNPQLALTQLNSALGQWECAFVNYVVASATVSGELINASNWAPINPYARRQDGLLTSLGSCPNARDSNAMGAYAPLHQARYLAEDSYQRIEAFPDASVPRKSETLGLLQAHAGYATLLLGEGWCETAFDQGPLQTRAQAFARAEERFTRAIALAQQAGNQDLRHMATLGRARARLNLDNLEGAATDAAQIPAGFRWEAEYSTISGRRENRVYNMHNLMRYIGVNFMTYRDLKIGDVADPRVTIVDAKRFGQSGNTPMWDQTKYPAPDSPIPVATWEEAQLIIAEARPAETVAAINRLRRAQDLPDYTPSGNRIADILEERRRQLFLEGHRLNDMLRHKVPFATGRDHQGQQLGEHTCLPLPDQERLNNPNIGG